MNKVTEYILKNSKKRDTKLKYDFMPSMLEIIEKPAHIGGTIIILSIFLLLIFTIIWACLSRVDVVVKATGTVIPNGNKIAIQAPTSGIIKNVYVTEGQYIEKGQTIMEIDISQIAIEENEKKLRKEIITQQLKLYNDILSGKDITLYQINTFSESFKPYAIGIIEQEKAYKSSINSIKYDIDNLSIDYNIKKINNENLSDVLNESGKALLDLEMQKISTQINKYNTDIDNLYSQHKINVTNKINELNNQLESINTQLENIAYIKQCQHIVAPISGYISELQIKYSGAVINQTQALAFMISDNTPDTLECYVNNKDISDIEIGDMCNIKLDAYPYSDYGTVKGIISYISKDSINNEKINNMYLVKVEILNENKNINIKSGLSGTVEIKVGKRKIISYFLDPITKALNESIREK